MNDPSDAAVSFFKRKFFKWVLRTVIGFFSGTTILFLIILLILMAVVVSAKRGFTTDADYSRFSDQVEAYRVLVTNECQSQGIPDYVPVVLAIMQCETHGDTSDPMNSSDKISNTQYGHNRGDIESTSYSIYCGVSEIKDLITSCSVTDLNDSAHLAILYEAYELNRGYVQYAFDHGGYSARNAQDYIGTDDALLSRNANFSILVAMYISLLTNAQKKFIHPLAMYNVLKDYTDDSQYIIFEGADGQVILSCSAGTVSNVTQDGDTYTIEVTTDEYTVVYKYVRDITIAVGDTITQGEILGKISWLNDYETYGMRLEMYKDNAAINPNDYLDVITVKKQSLDDASVQEGIAIAEYAKGCIDSLKYVPGGTDVTGCDQIGFIHNVYSNFNDYSDNSFNLPTSSWDDLINCSYVAYSDSTSSEIIPNVMYEGDVIIYADSEGNYVAAGIYVGESKVVHMTEYGAVLDSYNIQTPAVLLRFLGQKSLNMTWPIPGYGRSCITSPFSPDRVNPVTGVLEEHHGTDIGAPEGVEVVAAADGTVLDAGYGDDTGYHVIIDHGNGVKTYYYHSSELCVATSQQVTAGELIMKVGQTGQATGPHLHFGLSINGEYVDAMSYIYANEP